MASSHSLRRVPLAEWLVLRGAAALVVGASHGHWWSVPPAEAWGFATGGVCVWLVVREHPLNWPVGIANNLFFFVLFWRSRLFADMALQIVYVALAVYGWLNWIFGGANRSTLLISRATRSEWLALALGLPAGTWLLHVILVAVNGAAPFWDAVTTVLSLGAQYLLCRKRLENWWLWIAADVIYVPLYLGRGLALTAVLYAVFLVMCLVGLRTWRWGGRLGSSAP